MFILNDSNAILINCKTLLNFDNSIYRQHYLLLFAGHLHQTEIHGNTVTDKNE